jgi:hypothetical protein
MELFMIFRLSALTLASTVFLGCTNEPLISTNQPSTSRRPANIEQIQINCEGGGSSKGSFIVSTDGAESTLQFTSDSQRQSPSDYTNYVAGANNGTTVKFTRANTSDIHAPAVVNLPLSYWPPKKDWEIEDVQVQTVDGTGALNPVTTWDCRYKTSLPM